MSAPAPAPAPGSPKKGKSWSQVKQAVQTGKSGSLVKQDATKRTLTFADIAQTVVRRASNKSKPSRGPTKGPTHFEEIRRNAENKRREYSKSVAAMNAQLNEANSKSGVGFVQINDTGETASVKDVKYLRLFFDGLDTNQNGIIDIDELSQYLTRHYDKSLKPEFTEKNRSIGSTLITQLETRMDDPEMGVTFQDVLAMMYTWASKEGLQAMEECVCDKPEREARISVEIDSQDLEDMNDLWAKWDRDGLGEINENQFKEVLITFGLEDPADWAEFHEQIDSDGSGAINKDEFIAWWFSDLKYMKSVVLSH
mmetsp:Transcript_12076/g.20440  ORF Transcript_12076/g.20440 Transcript_12076/m.20440 type:complete len:311 (-) Transcript_12076:121-1053(-)|eukprot:CAMPEP_0198197822 /NCGR_PEP_ID=MMETSP1445-20131203/1384_1 /TAXON_ID=36898 /ORGANISM="Pyramimonas sp., Strain CCMP2087" /LENGTH=310 /DNA_ID=CAMNT_0043867219 /DNA_START=298 /DNA_END=1230 /DNA_ORIENTATION=-